MFNCENIRVNTSLAESASISYHLHFKTIVCVNSCEIIHKCNISMPDYCSINQYLCVTQYVSNLMSIFDPNSTPVCLLELYHLCRRIITDMRMRHESTARRWRMFYTENDHK